MARRTMGEVVVESGGFILKKSECFCCCCALLVGVSGTPSIWMRSGARPRRGCFSSSRRHPHSSPSTSPLAYGDDHGNFISKISIACSFSQTVSSTRGPAGLQSHCQSPYPIRQHPSVVRAYAG